MKKKSVGKVFLIGAGPGAADLITVRGLRLLQSADCVLHDALVSPELLAEAKQAELIAVGKRCGKLSSAQHFINKQLVDAAHKFPIVVRLKGGDPMLFGRAEEEIAALEAAGIEYEIVPGVTAALAASAAMAAPLTQRGVARSVAFITPSVGESQPNNAWENQTIAADTLVFYMGRRVAAEIAQRLLGLGRAQDWPVAVIEQASWVDQRVQYTDLGSLAHITDCVTWSDAPTLIVMGEVLRQRQQSALQVEVALQRLWMA
ncbi:uroporphyrinogen-III C-methyltransferase [Parvibium lacunae]|uniref:uroporphyrinogen-III C-methyltransferase n=1 Tax=Parvibium lacunae TaxID=1888893 RepID=A0A368KYD8_9BURK|nr:uroporphyrinogen-III C-methyltransferase [Parvibium lacunae]RCS56466.1 uroporphyrinogen-III C-methyltransferase [Parvibium lacunae]